MQGIYQIKNKQNGRVYIGQTVDFETRKSQHLSALRAGRNKNQWLQADYDEMGEMVFTFEMIEETADLDAREEYWINRQDRPYNKNLYRPPSRMDQMPQILRRIHRRGLIQAGRDYDSGS